MNKYIQYGFILGIISLTTIEHCFLKSKKDKSNKYSIYLYSNENDYNDVIRYIYNKYSDKINQLCYNEKRLNIYNDFGLRRNKKNDKLKKIITPHECDFKIEINYNNKNHIVHFNISKLYENKETHDKILISNGCSPIEQILSKLTITSDNKEILFYLIDEAKRVIKNENELYSKTTKETIRIFYYRSDYWMLLCKSPKRSIDTIYLKENEKENLITKVEEFFSEKTRNIYLKYGIPYKSVHMIYGPPGTGKTTTIRGVASMINCDVYIIPIVKDMLDNDLVSAFANINDDDEDNPKIIIIEDVDTIFDNTRKEGDDHNGITLQGFLNCLDGFTCIEGTMLFITANKPEILDSAFIRSCRIDHKLKLDYADKYQTEKMFQNFISSDSIKFKKFYDLIKHKKFTTAELQEFLFYNREKDDIIDIINEFFEIIDKNDPKKFEIIKDETGNFYS
jgi:SpoVK/Ycf46/Vps4 family AAA+-type ATPase